MSLTSRRGVSGAMRTRSRGFTIVELLIVIVVIAILAAITIVAFNGIQGRAYDTSVRSDLLQIGKKAEMHKIDNGAYPMGDAQLATIGFKIDKQAYGHIWALTAGVGMYNLVTCWPPASNPNLFAVIASSKSGRSFIYTQGGVKEATIPDESSSSTICAGAAGYTNGGRDFFYQNGVWKTYAGS